MAIKAAFVGINKYHDAAINNLSGACRDAVALAALFQDSIPGIDAQLFTNENATMSAVRAKLDELLQTAAHDDTIIFTFAGHGSPDHRLVFHDSESIADATMLPMAELAELFRKSPARSILCILDCCFS